MSTSWCERPRFGGIVLVSALTVVMIVPIAASAEGEGTGGAPRGEVAGGATLAAAANALEGRTREVEAREARLALYERDLTRRAADDTYFSDLDGYVTPGALGRALLLASIVWIMATLGLLGFLERSGIWRRGVGGRSSKELRELESRVLGGLREFDGLLSRVYERLERDVRGDAGPSTPALATPSGRRPGSSTLRAEVLTLAEQGLANGEIGRRLRMGRAEVEFILRTEAAR